MLIPDHELIEGLQAAKHRVTRMAWAFSLHLPSGVGGGGAFEVQREAEHINGLIDNALDKIERERIAKAV